MLRYAFLLAVVAVAAYASTACPPPTNKWKKVGCFADSLRPRPMRQLLVNMRDASSRAYKGYILSWNNLRPSLDRILKDCMKLAAAERYTFFGLQAFGECWSGTSGPGNNYYQDGNSTNCRNPTYKACDDADSTPCVGRASANYVYKIEKVYADAGKGKWSSWTQWSVCSKPCGGGERTRSRKCNKPCPGSCLGDALEKLSCNADICEPDCHEVVDIGIILDASGSVRAPNFVLMKQFIANLTDHYSVRADEVHFGAMHYSSSPTMDWKINDQTKWNNQALRAKVLTIPYTKGGTRTEKALHKANTDFFCGAGCGRVNAQKALILLTDGKNNVKMLPKYSEPLKSKGVKVIAVGIKGAVQKELETIASDPKDVINIKEFKYLVDKINKIIHLTCDRKGLPHTAHA